MNMKQRIRRNNLVLNIATVVVATSLAAYSFADTDYGRVKKDINVMIGIVKSSFEDDDSCRNCRVRITGHYLADQGVVFNVNLNNGQAIPESHRGRLYVGLNIPIY